MVYLWCKPFLLQTTKTPLPARQLCPTCTRLSHNAIHVGGLKFPQFPRERVAGASLIPYQPGAQQLKTYKQKTKTTTTNKNVVHRAWEQILKAGVMVKKPCTSCPQKLLRRQLQL